MAAAVPGETILASLLDHFERDGDAVFARFSEEGGEVPLTYRDLLSRAAFFARRLAGAGVKPRDLVFVLAPLGPDLIGAFLGAMLNRAVPAFLSYPSSKVAPDVYARNLRAVLELTGAPRVLSTRALEKPLVSALGPDLACRLLWLEDAAPGDAPEVGDLGARVAAIPASEVAFLQHSSGSTGIQKGVALSHASVLNQVRHYARAVALDPARDRIASWLPLYHDMGLMTSFLMPLVTGTPVVYMDPFRWVIDPAMLLAAIDRHRATLTWLPNFAYVHLAKRTSESRTAGLDLSCMRGFVNCSEPVRHASHRVFLERFAANGVREDMLWTCYAMAENTFAVTHAGATRPTRTDWIDAAVLASERVARPAGPGSGIPVVSCGPPIEGCEVRIVSDERRDLPERAVGEVALRSDSMLTEYHKNPEATAKALEGGWYFTGDLGYVAGGDLYITGRKKDLIIVGGRNFYPTDMEDLASEQEGAIPGRAAALGLENKESGTEEVVVVAETEVTDPAARAALKRAIQRAVLERLDCAVSRVELVPRGWVIKTSSGKVARQANLEKLLAGATAAAPGETLRPAPTEAPAPPESLFALALKVALAVLIIALAAVLRPNESLVLYRGF